jgi:hypothetical protein
MVCRALLSLLLSICVGDDRPNPTFPLPAEKRNRGEPGSVGRHAIGREVDCYGTRLALNTLADAHAGHCIPNTCMVRRTTTRDIEYERTSLRLCIRPSGGDCSPGQDEFHACLF